MNAEQAMILYKLRQIDTAAQIIREVHDVRVASEIAAWIESKADSLAEHVQSAKSNVFVSEIEVVP
jgi:hypothetical protein